MQEKYASGKEKFGVFLGWIFVHSDETFRFFDNKRTPGAHICVPGAYIKRN